MNKPLSDIYDQEKFVIQSPQLPAVPIEESVTPDFIVCLEDGRRLKMLKHHLRANFGLTPGQYREKWSLPSDYPMVAPNYVADRNPVAMRIGREARTAAAAAAQPSDGSTARPSGQVVHLFPADRRPGCDVPVLQVWDNNADTDDTPDGEP